MLKEGLKNDILLILEHVEDINLYFEEIKTPADFVADKQGKAYYDAILMHLQVTGEILKRSYTNHAAIFNQYAEVPWSEIIRMRDLISHHYDKLQHEIVFDICKNALPDLKIVLIKIIGD